MKYDFLCELCEQEHHTLSVRFLFIAVSEISLYSSIRNKLVEAFKNSV